MRVQPLLCHKRIEHKFHALKMKKRLEFSLIRAIVKFELVFSRTVPCCKTIHPALRP